MNEIEKEQLIKRYESMLNNQSIFVVRTDLNGKYTFANQHFCEIFGKKYEDILGMHGFTHIVPEDHTICTEVVAKCFLEPQKAFSVTLKKPLPDGGVIISDWEFSGVLDDLGQLVEIQCVGKDTTERFRLEQIIREKEKAFHNYFETNPVPTFVWVYQAGDFNLGELNQAARDFAKPAAFNRPVKASEFYNNDPDLYLKLFKVRETGEQEQYETWFFNHENKLEFFRFHIVNAHDDRVLVYLEKLSNEKRAILELDKTKDLLEQANLITQVGIWEYDFRTKKIYYSDLVREIFELKPEDVMVSMEDTIPFFKEGLHRNTIIEAYQRVLSFGTSFDLELQITTRKNRLIWIRIIGEAEIFQDRVIRIYGIIRDIDDKKKNEIATKHLAAIVESSADAIIGKDLNSIVTSWNEGAERIFGYSAEEMVGQSILKIFPDFKFTEELKIISEIKKGNSIQNLETIRKHKDGRLLNISITVSPIRRERGLIVGVSNISQDITLRKETERLLQESNQKFQSLVESVYDVIYGIDLNGVLTYASPNWLENLGYRQDELVGNAYLNFVDPIDFNLVQASVQKIVTTLEKTQIEMRILHKSGESIWHSVSGAPLFGSSGEIVAIVGIAHNIQVLKRKKEEILEAKKKAEIASKSKSEFIANVSHEIRTPLHGIIGFTELLLQTELKETQMEYMKAISRSAFALFELINDILDYSKIEEGKIELTEEKIDLGEFIYESIDLIKFSCVNKKLDLYITNEGQSKISIYVDHLRLKQVLINLLANAVKFTHSGKIELKIEIDSHEENERLNLKFSVIDSGIGIAESNKQRIFEAFTQEDSSTTKRYGGTGLGLTISNKLLSLMSSHLTLESEQGKGSCFSFVIPVKYEVNPLKKITMKPSENFVIWVWDENFERGKAIEKNLSCLSESVKLIECLNSLNQDSIGDFKLIFFFVSIGFWDIDSMEKITEVCNHFKELKNIQFILLSYNLPNMEEIKDNRLICDAKTFVLPLNIRDVSDWLEDYAKTSSHSVQNKNAPLTTIKLNTTDFTILLVEDNEVNEMLVSAIVHSALPSAKLLVGRNGLEALKIFSEQKVDTILMDIQMPEMNGLDATRAIRRILNGKPLPILGMSAGTNSEEIANCIEAGMDDFLPKPFSQDEFLNLIKKWLNI